MLARVIGDRMMQVRLRLNQGGKDGPVGPVRAAVEHGAVP
jgi:hypothetical protein